MPNIKSAIKRVGVNERKRIANKKAKSALRTAVKKAEAAIVEGSDNASELYTKAQKKLDQAATKGLLHKNKVARTQSRLAKKLQK